MGLFADISRLIAVGTKLEGDIEVAFLHRLKDETLLLTSLKEQIEACDRIVIYGDLDVSFVLTRALILGIDMSISVPVLDLHKIMKDNLRFTKLRSSDVMELLKIERSDNHHGREVPDLYLRYLDGEKDMENVIVKHCKEDVEFLVSLLERLERIGLVK